MIAKKKQEKQIGEMVVKLTANVVLARFYVVKRKNFTFKNVKFFYFSANVSSVESIQFRNSLIEMKKEEKYWTVFMEDWAIKQ